jgi:hypothetical protein
MTIRDYIESEGIEGAECVSLLSTYGWTYEEMMAEGLVDASDLPIRDNEPLDPDDMPKPISDEEWARKCAEAIEF